MELLNFCYKVSFLAFEFFNFQRKLCFWNKTHLLFFRERKIRNINTFVYRPRTHNMQQNRERERGKKNANANIYSSNNCNILCEYEWMEV